MMQFGTSHVRTRHALSASAIAFATFLTACTTKEASTGDSTASAVAATPPNEVTVRTSDYAFVAPDTIPAGPTMFHLVNEGPDFHHVMLVRLDSGHTMAELMSAMQASEANLPAWAVAVGGPNAPGIPGESRTAVDLTAGNYVMLCVIPAMTDGKPHIAHGMVRPLTVTAGGDANAAMPTPTHIMRMNDYVFELDKPLVAGRNVVQVTNAAAQPHEVVLLKLEPGKTVADFMAFLAKPEGPPPGMPIGGTTPMSQGMLNTVILDLESGDYALACFVPDAKDGKPHNEHGMVQQFRIN